MANIKGCFSHKSDDWATPDFLYWLYVENFGYFDPCPLNADFDGLALDWRKYKSIFVNPPYSNILAFVEKAISDFEFSSHPSITFLLPVRTDTKWFKLLCDFGCDIEFIRGRLKFGGSKYGAPFPSMLVTLNPYHSSFADSHTNKFDVTDFHLDHMLYDSDYRKARGFEE